MALGVSLFCLKTVLEHSSLLYPLKQDMETKHVEIQKIDSLSQAIQTVQDQQNRSSATPCSCTPEKITVSAPSPLLEAYLLTQLAQRASAESTPDLALIHLKTAQLLLQDLPLSQSPSLILGLEQIKNSIEQLKHYQHSNIHQALEKLSQEIAQISDVQANRPTQRDLVLPGKVPSSWSDFQSMLPQVIRIRKKTDAQMILSLEEQRLIQLQMQNLLQIPTHQKHLLLNHLTKIKNLLSLYFPTASEELLSTVEKLMTHVEKQPHIDFETLFKQFDQVIHP